jgi:hypothetical protein
MKKLIKVNEKNIKKLKGKTNWTSLEQQTDGEIYNAALSDPNARILKDYELIKMKKPK